MDVFIAHNWHKLNNWPKNGAKWNKRELWFEAAELGDWSISLLTAGCWIKAPRLFIGLQQIKQLTSELWPTGQTGQIIRGWGGRGHAKQRGRLKKTKQNKKGGCAGDKNKDHRWANLLVEVKSERSPELWQTFQLNRHLTDRYWRWGDSRENGKLMEGDCGRRAFCHRPQESMQVVVGFKTAWLRTDR